MSKATLESVAAEFRSGNSVPVERATLTRERMQEALEAYAAAKVREALEEALEIADKYNEFATYDAIKALIPGPVEPKQEAS